MVYQGTGTEYIAALTAPRKADGSLPDLTFMKPNLSSKLIKAGVDVGLSNGAKPDLGYWQTTWTGIGVRPVAAPKSALRILSDLTGGVRLVSNFGEPAQLKVVIRDMTGRVVQQARVSCLAGEQVNDIRSTNLHPGVYLVQVRADAFSQSETVVVR